jgi:2-polyprenyl-3-methyl-5-hydroxy-6-metoxy-1,4-benzoquinol methylase
MFNTLDTRKIQLIVKHLKNKPYKILDIFSGDCKYSKWIREHYEVINITAIDKNIYCNDVDFIQYEITCDTYVGELIKLLPYREYNLILLFDALEHVTCYGKLLELVSNVLSNDGIILGSTIGIPIDDINMAIEQDKEHRHLFTKVLLMRGFKDYGLEIREAYQHHEIIFFYATR